MGTGTGTSQPSATALLLPALLCRQSNLLALPALLPPSPRPQPCCAPLLTRGCLAA